MKKRLFTVWGLVLLCGGAAACSPPFAIFEDVGTDPHAPTIELVGVAFQPEEGEDGTTPAPDIQPADGFVVRPFKEGGDVLVIRVRFTDVGGDVQTFKVRDRDGTLAGDFAPEEPEVDLDGDGEPDEGDAPDYFLGTAGTVDLLDVTIGSTQIGPHRIEVWAEDSHESRSDKVEFTIQVEL